MVAMPSANLGRSTLQDLSRLTRQPLNCLPGQVSCQDPGSSGGHTLVGGVGGGDGHGMPQQLDGAKGDLTLSGTVCLAMALTILEVRRSGLGTGLGSACSPAAMAWNFLYLSRQATRLAWDTTSSSPDCREAAWTAVNTRRRALVVMGRRCS